MKALIVFCSALLISLPVAAQPKEDKTGAQPGAGAKGTETTTQGTKDAGLTGKVKSALAADVGLKTLTGIDVDSDAGVVTLKGRVDSNDTKKRAEQVAKKVSGVTKVKNELKVEAKKG